MRAARHGEAQLGKPTLVNPTKVWQLHPSSQNERPKGIARALFSVLFSLHSHVLQILHRFNRRSGVVDHATHYQLCGWAIDWRDWRSAARVELVVDGVVLATAVANQPRPDVRIHFGGPGERGFLLSIPTIFFQPKRATLQVRIASGGPLLLEQTFPTHDFSLTPWGAKYLAAQSDAAIECAYAQRALQLRASATIWEGRRHQTESHNAPVMVYAIHATTVTPRHFSMIDAARSAGWRVVICNSGANADAASRQKFCELSHGYIERDNSGFDFGSWFCALVAFGPLIQTAPAVIFANDSLYGPFRPLDTLIQGDDGRWPDYWSLTESSEIAHHFQSSFFALSQELLNSRLFKAFVAAYNLPVDKADVIFQGEVGLSQYLFDAGIKAQSFVTESDLRQSWLARYGREADTKDYINPVDLASDKIRCIFEVSMRQGYGFNPQHLCWDILLEEYGYPFLKRNLVLFNPEQIWNLHTISDVLGEENLSKFEEQVRADQNKILPNGWQRVK
jgi:hypothetical protein